MSFMWLWIGLFILVLIAVVLWVLDRKVLSIMLTLILFMIVCAGLSLSLFVGGMLELRDTLSPEDGYLSAPESIPLQFPVGEDIGLVSPANFVPILRINPEIRAYREGIQLQFYNVQQNTTCSTAGLAFSISLKNVTDQRVLLALGGADIQIYNQSYQYNLSSTIIMGERATGCYTMPLSDWKINELAPNEIVTLDVQINRPIEDVDNILFFVDGSDQSTPRILNLRE